MKYVTERKLRRRWVWAALAAALLGTAGTSALAEEQRKAAPGTIEEIVVTATKREASLMDVGESYQYLSGENLEYQGKRSLPDAIQLVPGATLRRGLVQIRGTGAMTIGDNPVSYYYDQIPWYVVQLLSTPSTDLFDVESLQVLRGPQGTLYGQGALGGTLVLTTIQPDLNEVRSRFRADGSSMNEGGNGFSLDGSISIPLIEDELAISLTGGKRHDPGLADGTVSGKDVDESDTWYTRAKLLWEPTDTVSVNAVYEKRKSESTGGGGGGYSSVDPPIIPGSPRLGTGGAETEMYGVAIDWQTPLGTLTSATSYLTVDLFTAGIFPAFDPFLGNFSFDLFFGFDPVETFNQEIRLVSNPDAEWNWIAGVNYTDGQQTNEVIFTLSFAPDFPSAQLAKTESTQVAVFGELSRTFMDGLITPLVGLRYFRDDRTSYGDSNGVVGIDEKETFVQVSPRFNLMINPSDDMMFFLNIGSGFRSGTFNPPGDIANAAFFGVNLDRIVPESTLWSYELGARLSLLEGALLVEPSIYYAAFEDYQFATTIGGLAAIISLDEVLVVGADLLLTWLTPVDGLTLSAMGSRSSSEPTSLQQNIDAQVVSINKDKQLPFVPKWNYRFGVDYQRPVGNWTASVSTYYFSRGGQIGPATGMLSPSVEDLSLRLSLRNDRVSFTLWSDNLTDDAGPASFSDGLAERYDRRKVGITLEYTLM